MVTTTIEDGNVYVTTGSVSGNNINHGANKGVKIFASRIEYDYVNELKDRAFKSGGERDETKPIRVIDLKRIRKIITVTGALDDEPNESANVKRNNLLTMGEFDGALTLVWGRGNYRTIFRPNVSSDEFGVFIFKQRYRETSGIQGSNVASDPQPFRKITVEIQFLVGLDVVLPSQ